MALRPQEPINSGDPDIEIRGQDQGIMTPPGVLSARTTLLDLAVERLVRCPSLLVASLRILPEGHTDISFGCLSKNKASEAQSPFLKGVHGVRYVVENDIHDQLGIDNHSLQVLKRHNKRAEKMTQFFNFSGQESGLKQRKNDTRRLMVSSMKAVGATLINDWSSPGHSNKNERVSSFQEIEFSFSPIPNIIGYDKIQSRQLMHFSCPTMKIKPQLFRMDGESSYSSVNIISGVCLCNANIGSKIGNATSKTRRSLLLGNPTLYEMEYIARCSPAIADLAGHIILSRDRINSHSLGKSKLPIGVIVDVPSFHYYASIDECLGNRKCKIKDALEWVNAIENRSRIVTKVFKLAILHEVGRRIGPYHGLEIESSPSAGSVVASYLRRELESQTFPKLDHILNELNVYGDKTWQQFWSLLPSEDHPKDFKELGYLFYVYQCIRPALMTTTRSLLIGLDEETERPLYHRVQNLLKELGPRLGEGYSNSDLVEIYLSPRVFTEDGIGSKLYSKDPTPEMPRLRLAGRPRHDQGHANARFDGLEYCPFPQDKELSPVEIVATLYGADQATKISDWFAGAGLDGRSQN